MEYYETIIVGGGPAGSSCAWQLNRQGKEVLILEKQTFPRLKLCGGWISSQVMKNLELTPDQYPHSILKLNALIYIAPIPFPILGSWCFPWRKDYSIRRIEFDDWLVRRSQATMKKHHVKKIEQQGEEYIIDEKYRCKYLLGAGGTAC